MRELLKIFYKICHSGFLACSRDDSICICFPYIVPYCFDIPEGKDMSAIWYGPALERPCIRCTVIVNSFRNESQCPLRYMKHTVEVQLKYYQLLRDASTAGNKTFNARQKHFHACAFSTLSALSLAVGPSFLKRDAANTNICPADVYSKFTFEPLHHFHLGISKKA